MIEEREVKMSAVEFYRCEVCGNLVALINKGGGTLVCCDQEMTRLNANSVDASMRSMFPMSPRRMVRSRLQSVLRSTP